MDDFPDPDQVQAAQSRARVFTEMVKAGNLTLRQLLKALAGARGHLALAVSPERIADVMQQWFEQGGADGFNLMPPIMSAMLNTFVDEVIPLHQRRGLFRLEYEEQTLRKRYRLDRPESRYFPADGNVRGAPTPPVITPCRYALRTRWPYRERRSIPDFCSMSRNARFVPATDQQNSANRSNQEVCTCR